MPELDFADVIPPQNEVRRLLAEALAAANPVDDLLHLADRLHDFEQTNRMSSAEFDQRYRSGSLDDELQHCTEWVAVYDLFLKTKRALESTLMRAAVQRDWIEVAA